MRSESRKKGSKFCLFTFADDSFESQTVRGNVVRFLDGHMSLEPDVSVLLISFPNGLSSETHRFLELNAHFPDLQWFEWVNNCGLVRSSLQVHLLLHLRTGGSKTQDNLDRAKSKVSDGL